MEKLNQTIDHISLEMIQEIKHIVQIKSKRQEKEKDAPFGKDIQKALHYTLDLAERLGFQTKNIDNYIGYAQYGEGDNYICAIGHLDVVEEGEGWKYPPFGAYEDNGYIYGRGILDNKGPIYSCLYALYAIKICKLNIKRPIRIIFGCNEETGFNDLKYYLKKEKPPLYGFTPDCKYPVVYAERGRAIYQIKAHNSEIKLFYDTLNRYFLNQKLTGETLGIDDINHEFGKNELRNFHLEVIEDFSFFTFSLSYIPSTKSDDVLIKLQKLWPKFQVTLIQDYKPVFFPKDSSMVQVMNKVYNEIMHDNASPVTTTGGTYAKLMPHIVPFGPSFPGQKGIGHLPNEWMKISDIVLNAKIYAHTLYQLANLEENL